MYSFTVACLRCLSWRWPTHPRTSSDHSSIDEWKVALSVEIIDWRLSVVKYRMFIGVVTSIVNRYVLLGLRTMQAVSTGQHET